MIVSLGYVIFTLVQWWKQRFRQNMYLSILRNAVRRGSVLIQRPVTAKPAGYIIRSSLVNGSLTFRDENIYEDNGVLISSIEPKQKLALMDWTAYFGVKGHYEEDVNHEDVMVLLEASRPANLKGFLAHQLSMPPSKKIHVLSHGAPLAWKSGDPFGILLHCSLEEFAVLVMAFDDDALTMDEDLTIDSILTVAPEGKAKTLVPNISDELYLKSNRSSNVSLKDKGQEMVPSPRQTPHSDSFNLLQVENWSNESLASNSSIGRVDFLDITEIESQEDILDGEDAEPDPEPELMLHESGSGEGLYELDASTNTETSSLSESWRWVQISSVTKPPNVLVYTGKKDSVRKFENVKSVLEQCLNTDCYVIYHLNNDQVYTTPWDENTALLVIATTNLSQDTGDIFHRYYQRGGKVLSLGNSTFDSLFLGHKELRPNMGIVELSYKRWSDVSLIGDRYAYDLDVVNTDDSAITSMGTDKAENVILVKVCKKSKSARGTSLLSQVLFTTDPSEVAVTAEIFNRLKKSNAARFEILSELLMELGFECGPRFVPDLTPAILLTKTEDIKKEFMRSVQGRLVDEMLRSGKVSLKFTADPDDPVGPTLLPVLTSGNHGKVTFAEDIYWENLTSEVLGNTVLYVDIVPTTMPLLEGLLFSTPVTVGLIAIAGRQTAGKGRGGNAWLSPVGCAMFTLHVRVPLDSELGQRASFLQHLTSLAVVQSVCSLPGCQDIPLRLKWPNDIYYGSEMKLGGVIITSTISEGMVHATIGCGFNVSNSNPTVCINDLIQLQNRLNGTSLSLCTTEQLIARTVSTLEILINQFQRKGIESFCPQYYEKWLHSGKKVILQMENNLEVTIKGLDDYGFLLVETADGKKISVQPDGNSFDMMKNLITMKIR
ncbi:hypothetical protein ACJMK2_029516 [Sinanodonta woodiana]|uniref:BPL/LPL catalytic domain-containing protein n=1 Tax=Sinanodonta woodiana TaxID=1069815 RepID=A0ABD3XAE1_SINWO